MDSFSAGSGAASSQRLVEDSSLPEHVARLAAANHTLTSSLQQAHADIAQLLHQRSELSDNLQSSETSLDEVCASSAAWCAADLELTRRRIEQIRESIDTARAVRRRSEEAVARLAAAPIV
jgi:hypothetical protein